MPFTSYDASAVEFKSDIGYSEKLVRQNLADTKPIENVLMSPDNNPDNVSTSDSTNSIDYGQNAFHGELMVDKATSGGQRDASGDTNISSPSSNSIANASTDGTGLSTDNIDAGIVYSDLMNVNAGDGAFSMYIQSYGKGAAKGHVISKPGVSII